MLRSNKKYMYNGGISLGLDSDKECFEVARKTAFSDAFDFKSKNWAHQYFTYITGAVVILLTAVTRISSSLLFP